MYSEVKYYKTLQLKFEEGSLLSMRCHMHFIPISPDCLVRNCIHFRGWWSTCYNATDSREIQAPSMFPAWTFLSCGCCLGAPKQQPEFQRSIQVPERKKRRWKSHILLKSFFYLKGFSQVAPSKSFHSHLIVQNLVTWKIHSWIRCLNILPCFKNNQCSVLRKKERRYWFANSSFYHTVNLYKQI